MKKYLILFLIFHTGISVAQNQKKQKTELKKEAPPLNIALHIPLYDEFIDHFNFKKDVFGQLVKDTTDWSIEVDKKKIKLNRKYMLLSVIDFDDYERKKEKYDSLINEIISNRYLLNFYDENWFTSVECKIEYENNTKEMSLTMKSEKSAPRKSRWVIAGANAEFLNIPASGRDSIKSLPPNNNDFNFRKLEQAFEDTGYINQYFPNDFTFTPVHQLFYLLKMEKKIKFINTEKLSYHLLQVPGWIIRVEDFTLSKERNGRNTGFLIADAFRATNEQKAQYRKLILNLPN